MNIQPQTKSPDFVISRVFDAPRDLVWKCVHRARAHEAMVGPEGLHRDPLEDGSAAGGTYHYGMKSPTAMSCGARSCTARSCRRERMVLHQLVLGRGRRHHAPPVAHASWPLEMLSVFTFEEQPGGKTKFTVRWSPHNATEEERKTFDTDHDSMRMGWSGTFEQLEAYLAKAQR